MATDAKKERIKVSCKCGAALMAPKKAVGKRVRCPRCSKVLTVPDPGSTADRMLYALADEEFNNPTAEVPPPSPEAATTERGTKLCPRCNGELSKEAVFCVKCGFHLEHGAAISAPSFPGAARSRAASGAGGLLDFLTTEPDSSKDPPSVSLGITACCLGAVVKTVALQGADATVIIGAVMGGVVGLGLIGGAIQGLILMIAYRIAARGDLAFSDAWRTVLVTIASQQILELVVALVMGEEQITLTVAALAPLLNIVVVIFAYRTFLGLSIVKAFPIWLLQAVVAFGITFGLATVIVAGAAATGAAGGI